MITQFFILGGVRSAHEYLNMKFEKGAVSILRIAAPFLSFDNILVTEEIGLNLVDVIRLMS